MGALGAMVMMPRGAINGFMKWMNDSPWDEDYGRRHQQRYANHPNEERVWKQMCMKDPESPQRNWSGRSDDKCTWTDTISFESPTYQKAFRGFCANSERVIMYTGQRQSGYGEHRGNTKRKVGEMCTGVSGQKSSCFWYLERVRRCAQRFHHGPVRDSVCAKKRTPRVAHELRRVIECDTISFRFRRIQAGRKVRGRQRSRKS